jgi:protein farnesyltransferase subunit beta
MSLKQPDGSFLVTHHAEVDVRYVHFRCCLFRILIPILSSGIYCLLVTATLLDLMTPELIEGTAAFIASCQTYEGGFSSSSQPYYSLDSVLLSFPRPPLGEAHGGYTFCSVASWILLQPFLDTQPLSSKRPEINLKTLLRWLVQVQGTEIELGGFKGRTNKLVDGCYSWWCGGSFALLEGLGIGGSQNVGSRGNTSVDENAGQEEGWDDADGKSIVFIRDHHIYPPSRFAI